MNTYCVPDILGTGNIALKKINKNPYPRELTFWVEWSGEKDNEQRKENV